MRKTMDMKQKIREASSNFLAYLSHQSPIGPEFTVSTILQELEKVRSESGVSKAKKETAVATFGNSHLISACLNLVNQIQIQRRILTTKTQDFHPTLDKVMTNINFSLLHSNPGVRREGERLFKTLYLEFPHLLEGMLKG